MKRSIALPLLIAAAAVAIPGVASAAISDCPAGKVCLFASNDYTSFMGWRSPGGGVVDISAANNDRMDSWINFSSTNAAWYHDAGGRGTCRTIGAKSQDPNISFTDSDRASSWRTDRGC